MDDEIGIHKENFKSHVVEEEISISMNQIHTTCFNHNKGENSKSHLHSLVFSHENLHTGNNACAHHPSSFSQHIHPYQLNSYVKHNENQWKYAQVLVRDIASVKDKESKVWNDQVDKYWKTYVEYESFRFMREDEVKRYPQSSDRDHEVYD